MAGMSPGGGAPGGLTTDWSWSLISQLSKEVAGSRPDQGPDRCVPKEADGHAIGYNARRRTAPPAVHPVTGAGLLHYGSAEHQPSRPASHPAGTLEAHLAPLHGPGTGLRRQAGLRGLQKPTLGAL